MLVLVIEDDANIRSGLRRLLFRKYRADVIEAEDGAHGLLFLLKRSFDLILLDLHMRNLNGLDTLKAIRRSPNHASTPVVMLTGDSSEAAVLRAMELGVEDFLIKPADATLLFERLEAALTRAGKAHLIDPNPA